jgi:hypothetical protein
MAITPRAINAMVTLPIQIDAIAQGNAQKTKNPTTERVGASLQ